MNTLKPGDRIAYKACWIKTIGGDYELSRARGVITKLVPLGQTTLAEINWENGDFPKRVNVKNICKVKSAAFADSFTR